MAGRLRAGLLVGLLLVNGPVSGLLFVVRTVTLPVMKHAFGLSSDFAPRDAAVAEQTMVFLNGNVIPNAYLPMYRMIDGDGPVPFRTAILSNLATTTHWEREDERTLVARFEGGLFARPISRMTRSPADPFEVGQRIRRPDFEVTVRATTGDGRPAEVAFVFDEPLESSRYRFVGWKDTWLVELPPPPVGARFSLPMTFPRIRGVTAPRAAAADPP